MIMKKLHLVYFKLQKLKADILNVFFYCVPWGVRLLRYSDTKVIGYCDHLDGGTLGWWDGGMGGWVGRGMTLHDYMTHDTIQ